MTDPVPAARFGAKPPVSGGRAAIVTSHPLATRAGRDALDDGGTVVDAALAAAAVQLVVEPHMTSLTGGLSMLHHDAARGRTQYLNGNVAAPAAPLHGFTGADLTTGRGVPVPGWWPAFRAARERGGRLSTQRLLSPAIELARNGFPVGPYLFGEVYAGRASLGAHEQGREVFFRDGALIEPGEVVRQERVARTLERLAADEQGYYLGEFARSVAAEARRGGGVLTADDLAANEARWSDPLRGSYRGAEILASVPPDDGGSQILEALAVLEHFDLRAMGPAATSVDTLELLIDVHEEVYYAPTRHDMSRSVWSLSPELAAERAARLGRGRAGRTSPPSPGTIHITVMDGAGNVASVTHSHMASPWVNGLFAEGFQLSGGGSFFQRGMPWPGEKAAVYLAPTLVLRDGQPVLACGSPSVSLVACVLQGLVDILDFGMSVEEAVRAPRFGVRPHEPTAGWLPGITLEHGFEEGVVREIVRRSADRERWLRPIGPWHSLTGNLEAVSRDPATGTLHSCADPRRNGAAEAW